MSYHVDYNPEMKNRYPIHIKIKRKFRIRPIVLSTMAVVLIYAVFRSGVLQYMIPGDPVVTTAAFSGMVEDIGGGESIREAFLAFCKEVIVNAG